LNAIRQTYEKIFVQRLIDQSMSKPAPFSPMTQSLDDFLSDIQTARPGSPIQAKLTVTPAGNQYEQEADTIAQQVVQQINAPLPAQMIPGHTAQRQTTEDDKDKLQMMRIQRQTGVEKDGFDVRPQIESRIQATRGGGSPIPNRSRSKLEGAFGADFSGVRVHTDTESDALNRSVQARAFTTGRDIFFRQGEYNPDSAGGQELLAHELTHVVQQSGRDQTKAPLQNQSAGALQLMRINTYHKGTHVHYSFDTKDLTPDQIRQAFDGEVEKGIYENALRIGEAYNRGDYLMADQERLAWAAIHLPQLQRVDRNTFNGLMTGVAEQVGANRWNKGVGSVRGIGTDQMGSCLTVGLTAFGPQGQQVSGLVHDVAIGIVTPGYASTVIGWLQGAFNGQDNLPNFNQLTQVSYFVVGGHPDTGNNVAAILAELVTMGVNISGVALTTAPDQGNLVKGVVVSPNGQIRYTTYQAEKAKPKEDEISKYGGFSSFGKPGGSSGGFSGFGKSGGFGEFKSPSLVSKEMK
jgi:hypothetical protein